MTVQETEAASKAPRIVNFPRHSFEAPELTLSERFYPMGFPVELRTNSEQVLQLYGEAWREHPPRYDTEPIVLNVHVVNSDQTECPEMPVLRLMLPMIISIADVDNYAVADLERSVTYMCLSQASLRHPLYASYFFLESSALCHIVAQHAAPVHAGCVEWNGSGLLLCGDSGAGKSTLSYACARAGFGYIADDAAFILRGSESRTVTGNWRKVRMRPESIKFFPEMEGLPMTPRAAGKPSIEIRTPAAVTGLDETNVRSIVFLNRNTGDQELVPYRRDIARGLMRKVVFGTHEQLAWQYDCIEKLLEADVYELRYTDLDWAIARLKVLAQDGR